MKTLQATLAISLLTLALSSLAGCRVDVYDTSETCNDLQCGRMPVRVQYALTETRGDSTVYIEAFSNPWFEGEPTAQTTITTRSAGGAGEVMLYLPQGDFYLRGYSVKCDSRYSSYCSNQNIVFHGEPEHIYIDGSYTETTVEAATVSLDIEWDVTYDEDYYY